MTTYCVSRNPIHNFLASVILVAAAILIFAGPRNVVDADKQSSHGIGKILRQVPMIGKRSGSFDDFFLKASKSVPRIGRRGYPPQASIKATESWPWYPKRPEDLSKAEGDDFWFSEDFAREMEQSPELWERMTADESADGPTGFTNEVWQREKRTGSEPGVV